MDGRDALCIMATGTGKSICYQLPPLIMGTVAVVVSPLIALMQDQVQGLRKRNISAAMLGTAQTDPTVEGDCRK